MPLRTDPSVTTSRTQQPSTPAPTPNTPYDPPATPYTVCRAGLPLDATPIFALSLSLSLPTRLLVPRPQASHPRHLPCPHKPQLPAIAPASQRRVRGVNPPTQQRQPTTVQRRRRQRTFRVISASVRRMRASSALTPRQHDAPIASPARTVLQRTLPYSAAPCFARPACAHAPVCVRDVVAGVWQLARAVSAHKPAGMMRVRHSRPTRGRRKKAFGFIAPLVAAVVNATRADGHESRVCERQLRNFSAPGKWRTRHFRLLSVSDEGLFFHPPFRSRV